MTVAPELGNGATIAFGTSGFSAEIIKISASDRGREEIPTSHLGTAAAGALAWGGDTWKPGKLPRGGKLSVEYHATPDVQPLFMAAAEAVTITFPLSTGEATPTIWSGSAFVTDEDGPEIENDVKMMGTLTLRLTGAWTITPAT